MRQPYGEHGEVVTSLAYPDRGAYVDTWEDDVCDRIGRAQAARLWADELAISAQVTDGSAK